MGQAASNVLESGVLCHIFQASTFPTVSATAIALCSNIPTDTSLFEVANAGAYARQAVTRNAASWSFVADEGGSGVIYNAGEILFPQASAPWGHISGAAVVNSTSYGVGDIWYRGAVGTVRYIDTDDQLRIPASGLAIRVS